MPGWTDKKKQMERNTAYVMPNSETVTRTTQITTTLPPKVLAPAVNVATYATSASPETIARIKAAQAILVRGGTQPAPVPNFANPIGSSATPTRKTGIDLNTGKTYGLKTQGGGMFPALAAVAAFLLFKK
jgi:hypothetical protein